MAPSPFSDNFVHIYIYISPNQLTKVNNSSLKFVSLYSAFLHKGKL